MTDRPACTLCFDRPSEPGDPIGLCSACRQRHDDRKRGGG